MWSKLIICLVATTILISCGNGQSDKQKELELKEKELLLKEKELKLKEESLALKSDQSTKDGTESKKNNELSNVENLIGYWFYPHAAMVNISFDRNGRFEFNDYNSTLEKEELLTGTYKLENGMLTLLYDDRPKQSFKFYKGERGDNNYYIKKSGYYFVKGENGYDK